MEISGTVIGTFRVLPVPDDSNSNCPLESVIGLGEICCNLPALYA